MSQNTQDAVPPIIAELVSQTADEMVAGMRLAKEGIAEDDGAKRDGGLAMLRRTKQSLSDAVTATPETEKFLQARGLTHMNQLDKAGRAELRTHLEEILAAVTATNTPA